MAPKVPNLPKGCKKADGRWLNTKEMEASWHNQLHREESDIDRVKGTCCVEIIFKLNDEVFCVYGTDWGLGYNWDTVKDGYTWCYYSVDPKEVALDRENRIKQIKKDASKNIFSVEDINWLCDQIIV